MKNLIKVLKLNDEQIIETTEPLIIWVLHFESGDLLAMPDFDTLQDIFYYPN